MSVTSDRLRQQKKPTRFSFHCIHVWKTVLKRKKLYIKTHAIFSSLKRTAHLTFYHLHGKL